MTKYLIIGLFSMVNLLTLIMYGLDKWFAVKKKYRISEAALLAIAAAGGSMGAIGGMVLFRHKTNKPKFRYSVPLFMLVHLLLVGWLIYSEVIQITISMGK